MNKDNTVVVALVAAMLRNSDLTPEEKVALPLLTFPGPVREAYIEALEKRTREVHVTRGHALTSREGEPLLLVRLPHDGGRDISVIQDHANILHVFALGESWTVQPEETSFAWFDDALGHRFETKVTRHEPRLHQEIWYALGGIMVCGNDRQGDFLACRAADLLSRPEVAQTFLRVASAFNAGYYEGTEKEQDDELAVSHAITLRALLAARRRKSEELEFALAAADVLLSPHQDATFAISTNPELIELSEESGLSGWWLHAESVRASTGWVLPVLEQVRADELAAKEAG